MINLDTNVLLRLFVIENSSQTEQVHQLLTLFSEDDPGYVTFLALAEMVWVLDRVYKRTKSEQAMAVEKLLNSAELHIEKSDVVSEALHTFRSSQIGFSDCLIAQSGLSAGCASTVTFDKAAAKALNLRLLS